MSNTANVAAELLGESLADATSNHPQSSKPRTRSTTTNRSSQPDSIVQDETVSDLLESVMNAATSQPNTEQNRASERVNTDERQVISTNPPGDASASATDPSNERRRSLRHSHLSNFLIGNFSFMHNRTIKICGMKFEVKFKNVDEEQFKCIRGPQIPYRTHQREGKHFSRVVKHGYDRRVPLIVCQYEGQQSFIVDGESRYNDISDGLNSGNLKIRPECKSSEIVDGVRMERPIPVITLNGRTTTRMERLAISVALNTSVRLDQPLKLGDVIVSLGSFIQAKYFGNGNDLELSKLLPLIDKMTTDTMDLQLLDQFLQTNTEHKDVAPLWTLENTPDDIRTAPQLALMNKYEHYKVYIRCALAFITCPNSYNMVFSSANQERVTNRSDSQWSLRLFSSTKFISLEDDRKIFILICLAVRQRMWGTAGVPFTTFKHTVMLIDLLNEIFKTASRSVNQEKLGKTNVPDDVFRTALLPNHEDEIVRQEPYIKSIFFFMVNWKENIRRFSKKAILKEVERDLGSWPTKRTWRKTETKAIEMETELWTIINRSMYAVKQANAGRKKSARVRKGTNKNTNKNSNKNGNKTNEETLSRNVVKSLENENGFKKLLDMGNELGIEKAVKQFSKTVRIHDNDQEEAVSGDEYEDDNQPSSMEVNDVKVPLTNVVKWLTEVKDKKSKNIQSPSPSESEDDSQESKTVSPNHEDAFVFQTALSREEVDKVSQVVKSQLIESLPKNSKNLVCSNLPEVFEEDGIWSHAMSDKKVEELRTQYEKYTVYGMKLEGIGIPKDTDDATRTLVNKVMHASYKKICQEKLRSQGYVNFLNYFENQSEELDTYMEYYKGKFDESNLQRPWSSIKAGIRNNVSGRYMVDFDRRNYSDLFLDEALYDSKLTVEVKIGMMLEHLLDDKAMKVDKRGSYPMVIGEKNDEVIPIYLHELGRYSDSHRRRKLPGKPSYQIFVTGKERFTVRLYKHSQFRNLLPWKDRENLSTERFTRITLRMAANSVLLVDGKMLFSYLPSEDQERRYKKKSMACIRMFVYDEEYDEDEDDNYVAPADRSESDSDPDASIDALEAVYLSEEESMTPKKLSAIRKAINEESESDDDEESSDESSNDEESSSENKSDEDSSGEESESSSDKDEQERPTKGRKGLKLLRKTPEEVTKLQKQISRKNEKTKEDKSKSTGGEERTETKSLKRRNSRLQTSKNTTERKDSAPKKKARNG